MSAEHDKQPATTSLVPILLGFGVTTVAAFAGMFAIMFYNHNGGF